MEMKAHRVRPPLPDLEHVLGRSGEGPRRAVDLGRAQGRAAVVQRDRPGRGQDPRRAGAGAGAGRVAEERAVVDGGVRGGAAVDEVVVDRREGGGGGERAEEEGGGAARAEQQESARLELPGGRLHLRGAVREQKRRRRRERRGEADFREGRVDSASWRRRRGCYAVYSWSARRGRRGGAPLTHLIDRSRSHFLL